MSQINPLVIVVVFCVFVVLVWLPVFIRLSFVSLEGALSHRLLTGPCQSIFIC